MWATEPDLVEDGEITLDANGVPLQIPVRVEKRFSQVLEDAQTGPTEDTQFAAANAKLFLGYDSFDHRSPYRYRAILQQLGSSEFELEPIPTGDLRTLFQRAKWGRASTFAVESDSGMWALSQYDSFVADVTTGATRYFAAVHMLRLIHDYPTDDPKFSLEPVNVPLAQVGDRILPMPSAFLSIPEDPQDQVYYVQAEGDDPIAMLVLGFQEVPSEKTGLMRLAYITPRRPLEKREADPAVYRVPLAFLRTTDQVRHERLLKEMRDAERPLPAWMNRLRFPMALSQRERSFTQAFFTLRSGLAAILANTENGPPLFYTFPCARLIAAAS